MSILYYDKTTLLFPVRSGLKRNNSRSKPLTSNLGNYTHPSKPLWYTVKVWQCDLIRFNMMSSEN